MTKNQDKAALKSLQWLRGWTAEDAVQTEFSGIQRLKVFASSCTPCEKSKIKCTHPMPTMTEKLKQLIRKRTLKPFFILIICSVAGFFSGTHHLMPFIVQILNAYQSPISPNWATVIVGFTGVCATIACILIVKFVGKRRIYLTCLAAVVCINLTLGNSIPFSIIVSVNLKIVFISRNLWILQFASKFKIIQAQRNGNDTRKCNHFTINFVYHATIFYNWNHFSTVHVTW